MFDIELQELKIAVQCQSDRTRVTRDGALIGSDADQKPDTVESILMASFVGLTMAGQTLS